MIQEKIYSFIDILLSIALCLACIYGTIESICHQEWLLTVIMGLSAISTLYGVFTWKKNKEPCHCNLVDIFLLHEWIPFAHNCMHCKQYTDIIPMATHQTKKKCDIKVR